MEAYLNNNHQDKLDAIFANILIPIFFFFLNMQYLIIFIMAQFMTMGCKTERPVSLEL